MLLVHSKTEEDTDQAVSTLETNQYEIVVHVNKLKEGLDVSNIYTLAVLRAAKANVLTEQIIGRGLRLPFGAPVTSDEDDSEEAKEDVRDLNALDIMPHKEFQKVVDEAEDYLKGRIEEKVIDRQAKKDAALYDTVVVAPSDDPKLKISIPLIDSEMTGTDRRLAVFPIKPSIDPEGDEDYRRRIEITDLRTHQKTIMEELGVRSVTDGVSYLVRAALDRCPETDAEDAPVLAQLARKYLGQLRPDEAVWAYAVALRKEPIIDDFSKQIKAQIDTLHPTVQVRREGIFEFKPWSKNVIKGYMPPQRKENDAEQDKAGVLIAGYDKSLYASNYFDSKQEKWLADCLERDKAVLRWVRLPTRQMRIGLSRTGYYPDFVAVVKDEGGSIRHYLLEVKAANKCDPNNPDPDVLRKYDAATEWVEMANLEKDKEAQKWQYRLLTDKMIEERKDGDFLFIANGAVLLR